MMPKNDQHFRKSDASEAESEFWRPCRGLSPGKGFAPNKATHYMTRRAFLSSNSNTAAREIEFLHASKKVGKIYHKNGDFSNYVNSFHSGLIFPDSLGQDLSRNAGGMSIYAF